jgi:hypothetical protein
MFFYFRLLLKEIFSELDEIKNQSSYLSETFTESEGETKYGNKEATPGGGVAPLWQCCPMVWAPQASTDLALPPINSHPRENSKHPSLHPRKVL